MHKRSDMPEKQRKAITDADFERVDTKDITQIKATELKYSGVII